LAGVTPIRQAKDGQDERFSSRTAVYTRSGPPAWLPKTATRPGSRGGNTTAVRRHRSRARARVLRSSSRFRTCRDQWSADVLLEHRKLECVAVCFLTHRRPSSPGKIPVPSLRLLGGRVGIRPSAPASVLRSITRSG